MGDSLDFRRQKTEATGTLSPPPNNGDKKKGNCLGRDPSHPATAQDVGRTNRHEQADDREDRAHFRNRGEASDQGSFLESALGGQIGVAPALIHVDVIVRVRTGETGSAAL